VLGDLKDQSGCTLAHIQSVENFGETIIELNVDDGTDDGDNTAFINLGGSIVTTRFCSGLQKSKLPVNMDFSTEIVGDKHLRMAGRTMAPSWTCPERAEALKTLQAFRPIADIILLRVIEV
jgi:hypothetical protein